MRIVIAGTTYAPAVNGQAIFTTNLAEGLAKRGHAVVVVFPSNETRAAFHRERNGVRLAAVQSVSLNFLHPDSYFSILSRRSLEQIIASFQPDIVHIQDHYPLCRDIVQVVRGRTLKLVGTNHFMPENLAAFVPVVSKIKPVYNRILWDWMLEVYNRLDVVTAQSFASANLLRAEGIQPPVYPVSCGIDLGRFHPIQQVDREAYRKRYGINPYSKVFLFVGRVDKEKKVDVLLRAMHQLDRQDIQLVIAGEGADVERLKALTSALGLGNRVRFIGHVPNQDLPALLNSVEIFTMPSEAELLSIATLEAMACGRPVLLANAVALPELVTNGVNGYAFTPGDEFDAAHYMAVLADEPERWLAMGQASLEKARLHSLDNALQQYEKIYEELLLQRQVHGPSIRNRKRETFQYKLIGRP